MRLFLYFLAAAAAQLIIGCGGNRKVEVVPAAGKLLLKQKDGTSIPMGGARVVFNPVTNEGGFPAFPAATAAADGTFLLGTHDADDGAPVGDYIVTVEWREKKVPKHDVFRRGEVSHGPDRLNGAYSDRARSPLRASVAAGKALTVEVPAP